MRTEYAKLLGWYLAILSLLLLGSSWFVVARGGRADHSFLILVPLAIGLLLSKSWARWGSVILGFLATVVAVAFATVHTFSPLSRLTVSLGPFVVENPSTPVIWLFAFSAFLFLPP